MLAADALDVSTERGVDGQFALAQLVVTGAGEISDEMFLNSQFGVVGHVVIETGHAPPHGDGFVGGKERTVAAVHLSILDVHHRQHQRFLVGIAVSQPSQALFTTGALVVITHGTLMSQSFQLLFFHDAFLVLRFFGACKGTTFFENSQ